MLKKSQQLSQLLSIVLIMIPLYLSASETSREIDVTLNHNSETTIEIFGNSSQRILWIPSEFSAVGQNERQLISDISAQGFEVWLINLHETYFIPPGRSSYQNIPVNEMSDLVTQVEKDSDSFYIFSVGRGSLLMLKAVRQWQINHPQRKPLAGMIMIHPNLSEGIAEAGSGIQYDPIVEMTNLPVYLIQPKLSTKYFYLNDLRKHLQTGGSSLFVHTISEVSDGYQVRSDATPAEIAQRKKLPQLIKRASQLLSSVNQLSRSVINPEVSMVKNQKEKFTFKATPVALNDRFKAPGLRFSDINGTIQDLSERQGKVVLVNFWASWCPPCVKEIPSLGRLQQNFDRREFEVISVDVGEEKQTVDAFLKKVPASFPVLLDSAGDSVKSWKVNAFPTTYIMDRYGVIRYGYYGGLEWDGEDVKTIIKQLLAEEV